MDREFIIDAFAIAIAFAAYIAAGVLLAAVLMLALPLKGAVWLLDRLAQGFSALSAWALDWGRQFDVY